MKSFSSISNRVKLVGTRQRSISRKKATTRRQSVFAAHSQSFKRKVGEGKCERQDARNTERRMGEGNIKDRQERWLGEGWNADSPAL